MRFDARRPDRAALLAPPYDVIAADERTRLGGHAENIVHLELPLDDAGPGTRYAAAARQLRDWMARGVLARDPEPALYAYSQRFSWDGQTRERRAVFGLLELEAPGAASRLHPHEATLSGPRQDRRRLLEATGANTSPAFLLAEDADEALAAGLSAAVAGPPLAEAETPWGTRERLWRWDGEAARRAARAVAASHLVFADGHHRFASAREFAAQGAAADRTGSSRYALAAIVPRSDPGLVVLPTHRLLQPGMGEVGPALADLLEEHFEETALGTSLAPAAERAQAAVAWLATAARLERPAFVLVTRAAGARGYALRPERSAPLFAGSSVDRRLRSLPVSVLQVVLERGLGLGPEAVADREALRYSHDAVETVRAVEEGAPAAFLVPPTPVAEVVRVASAGLLLPQKSTYFLPKLTSGWLLHVHERPEEPWRGSVWGRPHEALARDWLGAPEVETPRAG